MDKAEIIRRIGVAVVSHDQLNEACEAASNAGALNIEGPLWKAIWESYDRMLAELDVDGWISWFIYDNDCGRNAMRAAGVGYDEPRPIRNLYDLADLIESSLK